MTTNEIKDFLIKSHDQSPVFVQWSVDYQGYFFVQLNPYRCILYLDFEQIEDNACLLELLDFFDNYEGIY